MKQLMTNEDWIAFISSPAGAIAYAVAMLVLIGLYIWLIIIESRYD